MSWFMLLFSHSHLFEDAQSIKSWSSSLVMLFKSVTISRVGIGLLVKSSSVRNLVLSEMQCIIRERYNRFCFRVLKTGSYLFTGISDKRFILPL